MVPAISPVSDLRNYNTVLEKVKPDYPVYLTKNGHGVYSLHSIEDDEEFEKMKAMVALMSELLKGFQSGEEGGWLSEEDIDAHFRDRRSQLLSEAGR